MSADLAFLARNCPVVEAAVGLSEWLGDDGRNVTAGGSLRPADVPDAARALGVEVAARVRRAADVPQVHRHWIAAVGMGLIVVDGTRARRSQTLDDPLPAWWAGLQAVLAEEVTSRLDTDARIIAAATLTVATQEPAPAEWEFRMRVGTIMRYRGDWGAWHDPQRHGRLHPAEAALGVLRTFDVLDGTRLTPLGRWAREELRRVVPPPITPDMTARELLTQLADVDGPWNRVGSWIGGRTVEHVVTELVAEARDATPAERIAAIDVIDGLGREGVAALRATANDAPLAVHARDIAHRYGLAPEPGVADVVWLATEYAHADLADYGVAGARYTATDILATVDVDLETDGVDRIAGSGHPHAGEVADALRGVVGSPIPMQQLKIMLSPGCWRRVLVPENATLDVLHQVIIVVFGFDNDHLHAFTVGHRCYADSFHEVDDTLPEEAIRLHRVLPQPKATISHEYDFGASWRHTIVLEQTIDDHPGHLKCVDGKGANPIEYYDPKNPEEAVPFDADAINLRLSALYTARV